MKKIVTLFLSTMMLVVSQIEAGTITNKTIYQISFDGLGVFVVAPDEKWPIPSSLRKLSGEVYDMHSAIKPKFEGIVQQGINYELVFDKSKNRYVIQKAL